MEFYLNENKKGVTLIEMLVIMVTISILFATLFYIWNAIDIFQKSRDSKRINDLQIIDTALKTILITEKNINLGQENIIYTSLPDASSTCGSYNLIPVSTPYSYRCQTADNYLKIDGQGWVPVNFTLGKILTVPVLPVDPINNKDYFYAYQVRNGRYKLTARFESKSNVIKMANDSGFEPTLYEIGSDSFIPSPQSGLVSYWNFDETGAIVQDFSGYNNNGTMYSSSTITDLHTTSSCKIGSCANFDGVDDYVKFSDDVLPLGNNSHTVTAWINPAKVCSDCMAIFYYGQCVINQLRLFFFRSNSLASAFCFNDFTSGLIPATNTWQLAVWRWDDATGKESIFLNKEKKERTTSNVNTPNLTYGYIGGVYANWYWQGLIDEVRIYNRALSDQEIKVLYEVTE